jgi:uncharacterized protein YxjI
LPFCWKCGTELDEDAKYCSKCGMAFDSRTAPVDMGFLGGRSQFIITSKLEDLKDTGSIMCRGGEILVYFKHKHTWKPPKRRTTFGRPEAKTTDIRIESIDKTLLGEIHEFPPPRVWMWEQRPIRTWEIHNAKTGLKGIVREKHTTWSSDWVLENLAGEVIAEIKGNRKKKDYEILSKTNQIIARCYRSETIGKNSYYVDTQHSEIDLFLLLSYILVLHHAKSYPNFVRRGYVSGS